jgi:hypothetical protein
VIRHHNKKTKRTPMTEETEVYEEQAVDQSHEEAAQEAQAGKPSAEQNWQEARQVMEAQKAELEALKRQMSEFSAPKQQAPAEEPDEFADLDPSEYVTVEKAQRLAEKKAKQAAEKIVGQYLNQDRAQRHLNDSETKAREKFDDYDYVINTYVLPAIKNDPALAHKIQNSKDPAAVAYKLGQLEMADRGETAPVNPKAERILKNASRPVSGNAVSQPLKKQADEFAKMSQADVWKLSESYAKKAY